MKCENVDIAVPGLLYHPRLSSERLAGLGHHRLKDLDASDATIEADPWGTQPGTLQKKKIFFFLITPEKQNKTTEKSSLCAIRRMALRKERVCGLLPSIRSCNPERRKSRILLLKEQTM